MAIVCVLMLGTGLASADITVNVNVDGKAMPWYANASLNNTYMYGIQDGSGPTIVDSGSGLSFAAGGMFTLTYVGGLTSPYGGAPYADANGDPGFATKFYDPYPTVFDAPGSTGNYFPTLYISLPDDPAAAFYLNALVGTFADGSGAIVGSPFHIGNGPLSVAVPVGATRLQLGLNDDLFADNTGALLISVSGPVVPIPTTVLLFGSSLLGIIGLKRKLNG